MLYLFLTREVIKECISKNRNKVLPTYKQGKGGNRRCKYDVIFTREINNFVIFTVIISQKQCATEHRERFLAHLYINEKSTENIFHH